MKKIRIGNDIKIQWYLTINDGKVKLKDVDLVIVLQDSLGKETVLNYEVKDEHIEMEYLGMFQKRLGAYKLTAWKDRGRRGQAVVDTCEVFSLVACSHEECGSDNSNVNTETVVIDSVMYLGVSGLDIDKHGILTYNGRRFQLTEIGGEVVPDVPTAPTIPVIEKIDATQRLAQEKGVTYNGTEVAAYEITISPPSGCTAMYQIDGSSEVSYSQPFRVIENATIKAWSVKDGLSSVPTELQITDISKVRYAIEYDTPTATISYDNEFSSDAHDNVQPTINVVQGYTIKYLNANDVRQDATDVTQESNKTFTIEGGGSVSNEGIVSIPSVSQAKTYTISMSVEVNGKSGSATATISQSAPLAIKVQSISVTATLDTIYVGSTEKGTAQMTASVSPTDATNKEVEWSSSNTSIATVDADGLVTAKGAGQVTITATAKDGSGVKGEKQLTVAANSVVSTSEPIYGTPTITATYTEIEADGSNLATPTVTYKQTAEVTDTYADGSTQKRSLSNVTTGGTVTYTRKSGTATVGADGKVTTSSSTNTSRHSVAVVTVSVLLNGKTGTKDVTVYQKAYVAPPVLWYIGNITKTATQFAEMSVEELLESVTKSADVSTKKLENNSINKSVWYVMIPDTVDVKGAQFSAGGITSPFTADEIKTPAKFKGVHADVTIDGKNYKVYGYRNTAFESTAADGYFEII